MDLNDMEGTANLNQYLQPLNAPITQPNPFVNGFDFSTNYERDSISAFHLRNFNFNAGSGGTIVLGGTANGNGVLLVKNASGSTVVQANNNGLIISNGSITINDSSGSLVLDSSGIRSSTQFVNNILVSATPQTTTNTSYTDVTASSFTITATRSVNVLFVIFAYIKNDDPGFINNGYYVDLRLYDSFLNGQAIGEVSTPGIVATYVDWDTGTGLINSTTTRSIGQPTEIASILALDAGTHNYKLQFKANGGGTARISAFIVNIVILGT